MIEQDQLALFLDDALHAGPRAILEKELQRDANALRFVIEQQKMDRVLRSVMGNPSQRQRLKESILAAVAGRSPRQLQARVLADTSGRGDSPAPADSRSADWPRRVRSWIDSLLLRVQSPRAAWLAFASAVVLLAAGTWLFFRPTSITRVVVGQFAAVVGEPVVHHGANASPLSPRPSTPIHFGDRVETADADKAEIAFKDGTTLRLGFNTSVEVSEFKPDHSKPNQTLLRPPEIKLVRGEIWTKVQKLTNASQYAILTDAATAIARGTEFGVKLQRSSPLASRVSTATAILTVKEGTVDFSNTFGSVQATAMTESTAHADRKPTEPKRLQTLQVMQLANSTDWHILSSQLDWPDAAERLSLGGGWAGLKVRDLAVAGTGTNEIRVIRVGQNSPAADAGLRIGDVLTAIEGQPLVEASQVGRALLLRADIPTELTLRREGEVVAVELTARHRTAILAAPTLSVSQAAELTEGTRKWIEEGVTSAKTVAPSMREVAVRAAAENNLGVLLEAGEEMGPAIRAYARALQAAPQVALYRFNLGLALRKIGSFERAAEELETAVNLAPGSAEARKRLAEIRLLLGDDTEALTQTDAALQTAPQDHGLWELKSRVLSKQRRNAESTEAARKAVETDPNCSVALGELAGALYRQGESAAAEEIYRKAVLLAPYDPSLCMNLGVVLKGRGQLDAAERQFRAAVELRPDFVLAYRNLAEALGDRRQWVEAEAALKAALEYEPSDPGVVRDFGQLLLKQGRLDGAEAYFRKVLADSPHDAESHSGLARVMERRGNPAEAERLLRTAIELDPNSADTHNDLGELLRLKGSLDEAARCYHKALDLNPNNPDPYNNLGIIHAMQGKFAEAEGMFRLLLDRTAGNPRINPLHFLANLAMVCDKQGKLAEAEKLYRQVLALSPDDPANWNSLAWFLADHQLKLDEALSLSRRAVQAVPNDPAVLDTLGWVLFQRGDLEEAEQVFRKAIELAGNSPFAPEIRSHLKQVQEKQKKGTP